MQLARSLKELMRLAEAKLDDGQARLGEGQRRQFIEREEEEANGETDSGRNVAKSTVVP